MHVLVVLVDYKLEVYPTLFFVFFVFFLLFFCAQIFVGQCPSMPSEGKEDDECMCVQVSEVKPPCHLYVVTCEKNKKCLACKAGAIQQRFQCQVHSPSLLIIRQLGLGKSLITYFFHILFLFLENDKGWLSLMVKLSVSVFGARVQVTEIISR